MKEKFLELVKITKKLRSEDGCPWDKEQTFETLRSHIIEESYETISAIDMKDYDNLNEELGDLLLQILLVSNIAEEKKLFTIEDVIGELSKKLVIAVNEACMNIIQHAYKGDESGEIIFEMLNILWPVLLCENLL